MILHPRSEAFGTQTPTSSNGAPRPFLPPNTTYLTVHWAGAGRWLDEGDTPTELQAIQRYAAGSGKSWEYNYVVDGQGHVWEYAGRHQAAHSEGENAIAYGVLLLIGRPIAGNPAFDELPTDPMILAVRELRTHLVAIGALAPFHQMRPHREMPGAATECPSPGVMRRWDEFVAPWPDPEPDPPILVEDDDMRVVQFEWGGSRSEPFTVAAGEARWVKPKDGANRLGDALTATGQTGPLVWPSSNTLSLRLVGPEPIGGDLRIVAGHFAAHRPDA